MLKKIIILILSLIILVIWYFHISKKSTTFNEVIIPENKVFIKKGLSTKHGGDQRVQVDNFILEIKVYKKNPQLYSILVFLDNTKGFPVMPNHTQINIQYDKKEYPLRIFKNGLFVGKIESLKLDDYIHVYGLIKKKQFSMKTKIKKISIGSNYDN